MLKAISLIPPTTINKRLFMSLANISAEIFLVGLLLEELQRPEFQSIGTNFSQSETKQNIKDRRRNFTFEPSNGNDIESREKKTFSFRLTVKMIDLCILGDE